MEPSLEDAELVNRYLRNLEEMVEIVDTMLPVSKEKAFCITKLQEASMWLSRGLTLKYTQ